LRTEVSIAHVDSIGVLGTLDGKRAQETVVSRSLVDFEIVALLVGHQQIAFAVGQLVDCQPLNVAG
jgi:hypothetical protein